MPLASKENNYIDFDHEGLISKELSRRTIASRCGY
jgi:hypothetical protein